MTAAPFDREERQVADQRLMPVTAPAEYLPQPVDDQHGRRGGQRAAADRLTARRQAPPAGGAVPAPPPARRRPLPAAGSPAASCSRSRSQSAKAAAGIGRPRRKPWPMSHPRACSSDWTASDSTPSATTLTPSWCARSMVVRTIVRKLELLAIGRTRDLSSLSSSIGQPPRLSSEAKPVPKSSRATRTPELGQLREEARADGGGPGLLAHLEREHAAGHLLAAQQLGDDGRESGVGHAIGPDVDRDRDDHPGGGPGPVLRRATACSIRRVSSAHQAQLLGERGEQGRRQGAELGMLPPGERFGRHHPAGRQLDLGLEVGHQLPARQGVGKFGPQPRGHFPASTAIRAALLRARTLTLYTYCNQSSQVASRGRAR